MEWPARDLRRITKVVVTPLSANACIPTVSEDSDIELQIRNPFSFTVEPFRTMQIHLDLLMRLPTGVTRKILTGPECSPLCIIPQTIPSHYEDIVELSIQNTTDRRVSVSKGRKLAKMVLMTYY